MKYYITCIAMIVLATVNASADIPPDVQRVIDARSAEIRKLDNNYVAALERLKVNYTKRGDLETAVMIAEMIEAVSAPTPCSAVPRAIVGKWSLIHKEKSLDFSFLADGTFTGVGAFSGKPFSGRWEAEAGGNLYKIYTSDDRTIFATVRLFSEHLEWRQSNTSLNLRGTRKQ